ncbi:glycosyltransferase family 4 protein [Cryobacterium sp. SO2]|uniref:glycosyltransferase family 4 protein n=1 Tax=Cryobacterium sp. SO2 TaxID=1897060 RepID=UPI00223DF63D|nr:glycosyltransferase family 4 protein [Cryobacterium sp. SO2]WEO77984.1 glycosyltransferase family 4 protein [Cryobacterium sp. SO2]
MKLHIALCGPATLSLLQPYVTAPIETAGYPFPLIPTLAIEYLELGHTVSVVTTATDIRDAQEFRGERLTVIVVPSRSRARDRVADLFSRERKGVRDALRRLAPDIVHAHWTYEFALGAQAAAVAPVLVTAHDAPLTILRHMRDGYRAVRAVMAYLARVRIHNLTAVSPYLAKKWSQEMVYRRTIPVIPNPTPELELGTRLAGPKDDVVLEVADGSPLKNVQALMRAFFLVREVKPEVKLHLVGPGLDGRGAMKAWAQENGLDAGVVFLGVLDRHAIATEYANATVFCHASLEESQGLCLLEAMSARVPIVAGADSGGVAWTLFEGKAGTLVDVRDPRAISMAITALLSDPVAAAQQGLDAEALMRSRFSPGVVAAQYLTEYRRLIDAPRVKGEAR